MWRRPYRSQVWGPEGIPSHPEEGELMLPDSGERLLSQPVTTTLGPHSWGRHTESQCSAEKNRTRGRGGGTRRGFTCNAVLFMPPRGLRWSRRIYDTTWEGRRLQWAWRILMFFIIWAFICDTPSGHTVLLCPSECTFRSLHLVIQMTWL